MVRSSLIGSEAVFLLVGLSTPRETQDVYGLESYELFLQPLYALAFDVSALEAGSSAEFLGPDGKMTEAIAARCLPVDVSRSATPPADWIYRFR